MFSDFKFALRSLLKTPGFTAVAIITLALGIGATTAIFSVVNAVLLRPLPYAQPDRLMQIYSQFPEWPNGGMWRNSISGPEYLALQRQTKSWESIEAWVSFGVNIAVVDRPMHVPAALVSGGMFDTLGVPPALGRFITSQDDTEGPPPVVLSYTLWQGSFAGDPAIIGRDLWIGSEKCIVVGVMPERFRFPRGGADATQVWGTLRINPASPGNITSHNLKVLGLLKSGVTPEQARAELKVFVEHEKKAGSGHLDPKFHTLAAYDFQDEIVHGARPALRMLLGAACFLLLIACVNVANLLLARAETRQREIAIRGALGAGVWQLARQFMMEGLLLSSLGAMGGLLLAYGGVQLIKLAANSQIPRSGEIGIDAPIVLFAMSLGVLTGVVFGLAPLVHVVRRNLQGAMKSRNASVSSRGDTQRFRQALMAGGLAFALILLMGAGLMLRAFWNLQQVDLGFKPDRVTTMLVTLPGTTSVQGASDFWTRFVERLGVLPGVEYAALTSTLPPLQQANNNDTLIEGFVPTQAAPIQTVEFYKVVTADYFKALQARLLEGRSFDGRDGPQAPGAVVINQAMARTFWGDKSALGRRLRTSFSKDWYTVVGVAADVKNAGMENRVGTEVYFSHAQIAGYESEAYSSLLRQAYVVIRSGLDAASIVNAVRSELGKIDPTLPLSRVLSLKGVVSETQARSRFISLLLTAFSTVALMLAAIGIYGVISYAVAQRTREFGVRMALGARPASVLRLVLRQALSISALGVMAGLAGALLLTRFLSSLLFGVTPTDPVTFIAVAVLLGAVALLASYIPARRATRVDPMIALRSE